MKDERCNTQFKVANPCMCLYKCLVCVCVCVCVCVWGGGGGGLLIGLVEGSTAQTFDPSLSNTIFWSKSGLLHIGSSRNTALVMRPRINMKTLIKNVYCSDFRTPWRYQYHSISFPVVSVFVIWSLLTSQRLKRDLVGPLREFFPPLHGCDANIVLGEQGESNQVYLGNVYWLNDLTECGCCLVPAIGELNCVVGPPGAVAGDDWQHGPPFLDAIHLQFD